MTVTQPRFNWHDRAIRRPAHRHDPATAVAAGDTAAERSTERAAVLAALTAWPMTAEELDWVFPTWPSRNAAKRCSDLHTAARGALVISTGTTRPTRSGRQATVWTVTDEGRRIAPSWRGVHPRELVAAGRDRAAAGLPARIPAVCPYDNQPFDRPAGLIQHLRKTHGITRDPK